MRWRLSTQNPRLPTRRDQGKALARKESSGGGNLAALARVAAESRPSPATRKTYADGNAAAVAEICRRVDGLPLAIELAAARCALLSPGEIAERLETALGALGTGVRDAPPRQQTLRATIDWSHDLLSNAEKMCFARFAVFAGGATVEAAETITGADLDTLDQLVAKSLLVRRRHAHTPTRLGMLATILAYATDRLVATADAEAIRERHYHVYLALAQHHGTERALMSAGRQAHLAQLDADVDNFHAALTHAVRQAGAAPALTLCVALGEYRSMRSRNAEAVNWIERALTMPGADAHPALRVFALCIKAHAMWLIGRGAEQRAALAEAEAGARALGDPLILSSTVRRRAKCESGSGGCIDLAEALADEALDLATAAEGNWEIALAADARAIAAPDITELRARVDRAAALLGEAGNV